MVVTTDEDEYLVEFTPVDLTRRMQHLNKIVDHFWWMEVGIPP